MAEIINIDINDFPSVGSVNEGDNILLAQQSGGAGKILTRLLMAKITNAVKESATPLIIDGKWWVGGKDTGITAESKTILLRKSEEGIEWAYQGTDTWTLLVRFDELIFTFDNLTAEQKGELAFTYEDFTPEQLEALKKPATDAAALVEAKEKEHDEWISGQKEEWTGWVSSAKTAWKQESTTAMDGWNEWAANARKDREASEKAWSDWAAARQDEWTDWSNSQTQSWETWAGAEQSDWTRWTASVQQPWTDWASARQSEWTTFRDEAAADEAGRKQAETERAAAEQSRASAESEREKAEAVRQQHISDFDSAEAARVQAEKTRSAQESARVKAESGRVTEYAQLRQAWAQWSSGQQSDWTRWTASVQQPWTDWASARQSEWTAFRDAAAADEADRKQAETARAAAEQSRAAAESERSKAETARASEETRREQAESGRAAAEASRMEEFAAIRKTAAEDSAASQLQTEQCKEATDLAVEINTHPNKLGDNGNWWIWDTNLDEYIDSGLIANGGIMYPVIEADECDLVIGDGGGNNRLIQDEADFVVDF